MASHPKSSGGRKSDYGKFVNNLLTQCEKTPHKTLRINSLSIESGIEKRRLYDLMNVLLACDVCKRIDSHSFRWNGLQNIPSALQQISLHTEKKAATHDLEQLFLLPESPGIGLMTNHFLASFMYFGKVVMNIRDIALLMSVDTEKARPILRRLYLVAFLLERTGLVSHSQKIGEYIIDANILAIQKNTFLTLKQDGIFPAYSVEFMLSRIDDVFLKKLGHYRKSKLLFVLSQKTSRTSSNSDNADTSMDVPISQIIDN